MTDQPDIAVLREDMAEIMRNQSRIDKRLERIEHSLDGNGRPGIKTRLALLEAWAGSMRRLGWIAIGAALTSVTAMLLNLFFRGG